MSNVALIKQAIITKGEANLRFTGKSMYPTLKDSTMLTIANISPEAIDISDIITYQQNNTIVAHRVIDIIHRNGHIIFITKGDNQPFGGIGQIEEKDLIGRVEHAFYKGFPERDILIRNKCYGLIYVLLGRLYLFYRKFIKRYLPKLLRISLKGFVATFYSIFKRLA